jgi:hypothetical protein
VDIHGVHDRTANLDRFAAMALRPEKPSDLEQELQRKP